MTTDLVSLNYSSSTTLSSLTGTATTSSTSSSSSDSDGLKISGDDANFSKGAETMKKLSDLASSDPEKFKEAAQQISDSLSEAAGNASDSNEAKLYSDMASKFAEAAKSGSMSSLTPPKPPTGASGTQAGAAQAYGNTAANTSGSNPMSNVDSIISGVLSGVGATEG
ncbi:MAG: hypothetical protein ACP59X_06165 [Solidesulfovibrio sp. DCME]|uniref:hypothetical protein n=1 Tax=Solidesulfovibrio sp. DCME TaxID=3447380 RepID=UPI003D148874